MKKTITIENGSVKLDGQHIARYDEATDTVSADKRFSPRFYKPIAEALGHQPQYDFGEKNTPSAAMVSAENSERVPLLPDETPQEESPKAKQKTKSDVNPEPPQDPRFGDKTPAWARWLRETDPEAFEKRFAGRKINLAE